MMSGWWLVLSVTIAFPVTLILVGLATCFYNLYLHPLASYPGPYLARATKLWSLFCKLRGTIVFDVERAHRKYGHIVRVAPDELSYTDPQAWYDIYGWRPNQTEIPKDPETYSDFSSLICAQGLRHKKLRHLMNKQFSDAAIGQYEPLIQRYVDLCISGLREQCRKSSSIDINEWFESFTFDLAGDLIFGEPFGGLRIQGKNLIPEIVSTYIKYNLFTRTIDSSFPKWLAVILNKFIPQYLLDSRIAFHDAVASKALARLKGTTKPDHDLLGSLTAPDSGVTNDEITSTAMSLIAYGASPSASLLTAATHLLLTHPSTLTTLLTELHSIFTSRSQITLASTSHSQLPLLSAVLAETLRLFPPYPSSLPRRTSNPSESICARRVPSGTIVSIYAYAMAHSALNFFQPEAFIPERWLQPSTNPGLTGPTSIEVDRRDASQPFGLGPRGCVGRELALGQVRVMLCCALWEFDFELKTLAEGDEGERGAWPPRRSWGLWERRVLVVGMRERKGAREE